MSSLKERRRVLKSFTGILTTSTILFLSQETLIAHATEVSEAPISQESLVLNSAAEDVAVSTDSATITEVSELATAEDAPTSDVETIDQTVIPEATALVDSSQTTLEADKAKTTSVDVTEAPGTADLDVEIAGHYNSDASFDNAGAEIAAYNQTNQKLYSVNGDQKALDIIDTKNLKDGEMILEDRIFLADFGLKVNDLTSVDVHPSGQYIGVAASAIEKTDPGFIVFFNSLGQYINAVTVGALPDNLAFTHDGRHLFVANEGEPNDDYTVNPAGGLSVITLPEDIKTISQKHVNTINLKEKDMPDDIRHVGPKTTPTHLNAEPEFIAIDKNDKFAYVSIQELNALAKFDIEKQEFVEVKFLGYLDHSVEGHGIDPSDRDDKFEIRRVTVLGLGQPDAISLFEVNDDSYIILPNEGDSQDYDGYSEEIRVKHLAKDGLIELKAEHYAGYTQAELDDLVANGRFDDEQLGRLLVTLDHPFKDGNIHNALVAFGGRSFTILRASDMEIVYNSGDDFEQLILEKAPEIFNSDIESPTDVKLDGRSDNKGPEPETIEVADIGDRIYAFIALERTSGVMIYDVTNPEAPFFVNFFHDSSFTDVSPEGLEFVPADQSPTGQPLLFVSYEASGTISAYNIIDVLGSELIIEDEADEAIAGDHPIIPSHDEGEVNQEDKAPAVATKIPVAKEQNSTLPSKNKVKASSEEVPAEKMGLPSSVESVEELPQTGENNSLGLLGLIMSALGLTVLIPGKRHS